MRPERTVHQAPIAARRPAAAQAQALAAGGGAGASTARALQQRIGSQGTRALVARASSCAAPVQAAAGPSVQRLATVGSPNDRAEAEAHTTASKVVRMAQPPAPAIAVGSATSVQRADAGAGMAGARVQVNTAGGTPLPAGVRNYMEPRFGADFGNVRIHTDAAAANQASQLNAHAFTYGKHVYFGRNRYQPDTPGGKELIAHELTHTIQQGAAVQRSMDATVTERSAPGVQRLGFWDAVASWANEITGYFMLTVILGINPINMAAVERSAANILRALIKFMPGGALIAQALDKHGILDRVATWADTQVRVLGVGLASIRQAMDAFLATVGLGDIASPRAAWERAKRIFTDPIGRMIELGKGMVTGILGFIREAILLPLAALASQTKGYDLLKAVLGEDPVSGQPVERSPENLIGGFMKLIGQEEVWENIKKANAIARAWAWFQAALAGLTAMVRQIPTLFVNAFKALQIDDLLDVPKAFLKVTGIFVNFALQFVTWAGSALYKLLEIIFEVLAPAALPYLKKAGDAFKLIVKDPVGFIRNLIAAVVGGVKAFVANIWTHLKAGFIKWLFGALADAGIAIPDGLPSLPAILQLVANVLGLTMARLRVEATKMLGPTAVAIIEKLVEYVKVLWEGGFSALWAKIKDDIGNLKDMAIDAIQSWLVETIVKQAVVKLVSLFNPAGAFIQAILAIYNTIQVIIERIGQIASFVGAVINSIHAIATGAIGPAVKAIEGALANAVPLVLAFLAGLAGIGGLAAKVKEILEKAGNFVWDAIRKLVKKGIDAIKKMFAKLTGKDKPDERTPAQKQADLNKGMAEADAVLADDKVSPEETEKRLPAIQKKYRLTRLALVRDSKTEDSETDHIEGEVNPKASKPPHKKPKKGETNIKVVRSTFSVTTKWTLQERDPEMHKALTRKAESEKRARLKKELDRRHVISSQSMAAHYEAVLNAKKYSVSAKILRDRGQPVAADTNPKIQEAAQARHRVFFNDVENLFIGDASENRSIGAETDIPSDWDKKVWRKHLAYVRKTHALDNSFTA